VILEHLFYIPPIFHWTQEPQIVLLVTHDLVEFIKVLLDQLILAICAINHTRTHAPKTLEVISPEERGLFSLDPTSSVRE